jgi:hypothetical protein
MVADVLVTCQIIDGFEVLGGGRKLNKDNPRKEEIRKSERKRSMSEISWMIMFLKLGEYGRERNFQSSELKVFFLCISVAWSIGDSSVTIVSKPG